MHELLLHASVPAYRHDHILSILAGIAAMQAIPILEKHLIFKPSRPPTVTGKAGPQQGGQAGQMKALQGQMHGDLFYLKVVEEVKDERATLGGQSSGTNGEGEKGDVVMADDGVADVRVLYFLSSMHIIELGSKENRAEWRWQRQREWLGSDIMDATLP